LQGTINWGQPSNCSVINLQTSTKISLHSKQKQKARKQSRTTVPSFPGYKHLGTPASQMESTISGLSTEKNTSAYTQTVRNCKTIGIAQQYKDTQTCGRSHNQQ